MFVPASWSLPGAYGFRFQPVRSCGGVWGAISRHSSIRNFKMMTRNQKIKYGSSILLLAPVPAFAAMDVAAALAGFADVNTAVPVVGAAFLLALGILAAWKLIRGAFA